MNTQTDFFIQPLTIGGYEIVDAVNGRTVARAETEADAMAALDECIKEFRGESTSYF